MTEYEKKRLDNDTARLDLERRSVEANLERYEYEKSMRTEDGIRPVDKEHLELMRKRHARDEETRVEWQAALSEVRRRNQTLDAQLQLVTVQLEVLQLRMEELTND